MLPDTVDSCRFTHRGIENSRRVFLPADAFFSSKEPSFMRDWKPSDAAKCGIFGISVEDSNGFPDKRMCPGTQNLEYYCCMVDVAVVPLFHIFQQNPYVLNELDEVCNRPYSPTLSRSTDTSYPIFSKTKIQSLIQGGKFSNGKYYAVPSTGTAREETIIMYMNLLNELLHEFSPPSGECGGSLLYPKP
jgi:hypothetical protein